MEIDECVTNMNDHHVEAYLTAKYTGMQMNIDGLAGWIYERKRIRLEENCIPHLVCCTKKKQGLSNF